MSERQPGSARPEPGDIVLGCKHAFEVVGIWHFFYFEDLPTFDIDDRLISPNWVVLCQECFMLPGQATERVGMWFEWEDEYAGEVEHRKNVRVM